MNDKLQKTKKDTIIVRYIYCWAHYKGIQFNMFLNSARKIKRLSSRDQTTTSHDQTAHFGREKNVLPTLEIHPRSLCSPACNQVTVLTELSWLLACEWIHSTQWYITSFRGKISSWSLAVACPGILFGWVQQIQLRTEDRENGDLGAVAP